METSHTPGPWKAHFGPGYTDISHVNESGRAGRLICSFSVPTDADNANARLIAAAPDLLEGCKRALSILEAESAACKIYKAHWAIISAAIAKATQG